MTVHLSNKQAIVFENLSSRAKKNPGLKPILLLTSCVTLLGTALISKENNSSDLSQDERHYSADILWGLLNSS